MIFMIKTVSNNTIIKISPSINGSTIRKTVSDRPICQPNHYLHHILKDKDYAMDLLISSFPFMDKYSLLFFHFVLLVCKGCLAL